MQNKKYQTTQGQAYPAGVKQDENGVNFSIFSHHATYVELLLFTTSKSKTPFQIIVLDKKQHKTFVTWHVYVVGLPVGTWYVWRMDGAKEEGLYFDKNKHLLDPLARTVSNINWDRQVACLRGDNGNTAMRCMVVKDAGYDWQGDKPLSISDEKSIIYELHIGGYTRHASAKVKNPGTFSGLIEKIPYLKKLGITHVELLPIMAFDEQDIPQGTVDKGLKNYWGYSTHSFFSPHPSYCVTPQQGTHITEFCDMVKALHTAGIGIILDVVYNHTAEAGTDGPVINFRGMYGNMFYHHNNEGVICDYTGCGNTVNANHHLVSAFIVSSLEYWVRDMHVDGFRFDLASALVRGEDGGVLENPPVLWAIELSEQLAKTKLIAEAWDAAGLYQVGNFPGYRWAEWNDKYRDVVRKVLHGDTDKIQELATRISGSGDIYGQGSGLPTKSINFITCHDGYTLNDLFSYNEKHNVPNGEENRDGCNHNISYNYGEEGHSTNVKILQRRKKQAKNALAILLLSNGVPMLLAGDEMLNSQQGNNNTYCQDNEIAWIDWQQLEKNHDIFLFVQQMIILRKRHNSIMRKHFLTGEMITKKGIKDITWHGAKLNEPRWNDPENRLLAFTLAGTSKDEADLHVVINMSEKQITIELPKIKNKIWCLAVNTSAQSPKDIISPSRQNIMKRYDYQIDEKTILVFENKKY